MELALGSYELAVVAACGHGDIVVVTAILCGRVEAAPALAEDIESKHGVLHGAEVDCRHYQAALAIVCPLACGGKLHQALVGVLRGDSHGNAVGIIVGGIDFHCAAGNRLPYRLAGGSVGVFDGFLHPGRGGVALVGKRLGEG